MKKIYTHDMTDPAEDAEALRVTFSTPQAEYLVHHLRNAVQMGMSSPAVANARLLALAETVETLAALRRRRRRLFIRTALVTVAVLAGSAVAVALGFMCSFLLS